MTTRIEAPLFTSDVVPSIPDSVRPTPRFEYYVNDPEVSAAHLAGVVVSQLTEAGMDTAIAAGRVLSSSKGDGSALGASPSYIQEYSRATHEALRALGEGVVIL